MDIWSVFVLFLPDQTCPSARSARGSTIHLKTITATAEIVVSEYKVNYVRYNHSLVELSVIYSFIVRILNVIGRQD